MYAACQPTYLPLAEKKVHCTWYKEQRDGPAWLSRTIGYFFLRTSNDTATRSHDDRATFHATPAVNTQKAAAMERRQSSLPRLLPVLLWSCWFGKNPEAATSSSESCIPLAGVESGGGEGTLDFDIISTMLGTKDIFDLSIPILPTVAACSSDLETPISMRHLLGEHKSYVLQMKEERFLVVRFFVNERE